MFVGTLEKDGENKKLKKVTVLVSRIERGIENYFGADVKGWHTYRYHAGVEVIRAWNCLPVYMGIPERAKDTFVGIEKKLWKEGGCQNTEEEKIL